MTKILKIDLDNIQDPHLCDKFYFLGDKSTLCPNFERYFNYLVTICAASSLLLSYIKTNPSLIEDTKDTTKGSKMSIKKSHKKSLTITIKNMA